MALIHQKVDSNNLKSDVDKLEKIYEKLLLLI